MQATTEFMLRKFEHFNVLIFNGALPTPTFIPSKARTYLGRYECSIRHHLLRRAERYNHRIRFSTAFDLSETELEDVLIHEMIHYHLSYHDISDTAPHGLKFKALMGSINVNFGRHLTVSRRLTPDGHPTDQPIRRHCLCIMTLPDGTHAFTPVTQQSMFTLWDKLPQTFSAVSATWYSSLDPFWSNYRRLSAGRRMPTRLRCYPIEADVLALHLDGAVALEKSGRVIKPREKRQ